VKNYKLKDIFEHRSSVSRSDDGATVSITQRPGAGVRTLYPDDFSQESAEEEGEDSAPEDDPLERWCAICKTIVEFSSPGFTNPLAS
jgi:hypothetical protein